jgi:hypothetical protein
MIEAFAACIATYAIFAFAGMGAYVAVFSRWGIGPKTLVVYPPLCGCACVVVGLTHCVSLRLEVPRASLAMSGVLAVWSGVAIFYARRELLRAAKACLGSRTWWMATACALAAGLLIMASACRNGRLNSPYRLGIDQVGYIATASTLMSGKTIDDVRMQLLKDTGKRDRAQALKVVESSIHYTNQVSAVFLFGAARWGFSLLLVYVSTLLRLPNPALAVYPLISFSVMLLGGLVFRFCRDSQRLPGFPLCLLVASSVGLNCNLLNVSFDGQLGQAFFLPYFFCLWTLIAAAPPGLRRATSASSLVAKAATRATAGVAVLAVAAIVCSYGEFMIALAVLFALAAVVGLGVHIGGGQRLRLHPFILLVVAIGAGVVITGGFGWTWLFNMLSVRMKDVHIAGWMQPRWATPLEILGFRDMYVVAERQLVPRGVVEVVLQAAAHGLLALVVAVGVWKRGSRWVAVYLPPIIFVALVYVDSRYVRQLHNYRYMKAYTMAGPMLFLAFAEAFAAGMGLGGGEAFGSRRPAVLWRRCCAAAVLVAPMLVGLGALQRFHAHGTSFAVGNFVTFQQPQTLESLSNYVLVTPGPTPLNISAHSLAFQFPFHWLHERRPLENTPYRDWRIAAYLPRETAAALGLPRPPWGKVVVEASDAVVIDTGLRVADVLTPGGRGVDWRAFGEFATLFGPRDVP